MDERNENEFPENNVLEPEVDMNHNEEIKEHEPVAEPMMEREPVVEEERPPMPTPPPPAPTPAKASVGSLNYIQFVIAVLLKPITTMKKEVNKFEDVKNTLIFAGLVAGITTIVNLIKIIFNTVYTPAFAGFMGFGERKAEWDWSDLSNLKWGEAIFKNLIIFVGVLVAITLVYFLAGLILKKQTNFLRLLGIASVAVIPAALCMFIISPLLGMIYSPLGFGASIIGGIYTLLLLIDSVNRELSLEDNDMKLFVNIGCLSILVIAGYYAFMKFFLSIPGGLGDLLDLF